MFRSACLVLSLGLLGLAACGGDSEAGRAAFPKEATFRNDIAPIFATCALCHHAGNGTVIDLFHPFDPVNGIVGRPSSWTDAAAKLVVDPGNVDNSFLIVKVERTDLDIHVDGTPMPWNIPPLDATEIATIRQWIQDGAKNDDSFTVNIAPIFGDGKSLGSRGGKCAYCHGEGSGQLPDLTRPFDPTVGIVNVAGRVIPGDPAGSLLVKKIEGQMGVAAAMPYQQPRLAAAQIEALKSWITAGAKND